MNHNSSLPANWQFKKLGEVADYINGRAFKPSEWEKTGRPIIRIQNLNNIEAVYNYSSQEFEEKYKIGKGDLLYAWSASLGVYIWYGNNAWLNQHIFKVLPKPFCDKKYLFYFLEKITLELYAKTHGSGMVHVTKGKFEETVIPLPPLPEQQAIVSKIEELFSELDNGKQQLLTAQQQSKVYRQSLLKWAFEGKLTSTSLSERGARWLSEAETTDGELPKGWKWMKLDTICSKIQDGSHFSPQVQFDEPGENRFKYITAKNIRNDHMDFRKLSYVEKDFHESIFGRCNPEFGDVLLTKDGINTGEVTLNTLHEPFSLLSSVCIFKTKKDLLISSFLKYFIQSPLGNKAILDSMTGTAIKRIVLRKIKDSIIALPPINEQQLIVDELESKLTVCDKIEETIANSLQQAEALRQSILKRAFEGRLVNHY